MQVRILGSSAGGGFPQWNCACANCAALRSGRFSGKARTQTGLAISADKQRWLLLDASPDLRAQIESSPQLLPRASDAGNQRNTPIAAVILTCADVDRVLGLLLLREFQPLRVYATAAVQEILMEENSIFRTLQREPRQIVWHQLETSKPCSLADVEECPLGLECVPLALEASYPQYVTAARRDRLSRSQAVIALQVSDPATRRNFFYAPSLPKLDADMLAQASASDLLFVDGTFWSEDELIRARGGAGRSSAQMGHLPVSGAAGTLQRFARAARPKKIYIHINHTNPMLDEHSPQFAQIAAAGWSLATDSAEFTL